MLPLVPELTAGDSACSVSRFRRCNSDFMSERMLVTQISVFLQCAVWLHLPVLAECRDSIAKVVTGRSIQDGVRNERRTFSTEWQRPRSHFVENNTKGKQVRARIQVFGRQLFG